MRVDENIWGSEYVLYDNLNERDGTTSLSDQDYIDYPPFTRNNLAALGSNPTGGNFDNDAIYIGYINGSGFTNPWSPGADFNYSIAYTACKNPDIFINNTIGVGVAQQEATINYDYNYTRPKTKKAISLQRSGSTKTTPIMFKNYQNYMEHRPNKSGGQQTLAGSDAYQPYYSSMTAPGVYNYNKMWTPDGAMRETAGWDTTAHRNDVNINGYMSYWRDFGIRSLIGVIKVIYFDGTYNQNTGVPENVSQAPITLHDYEANTQIWRDQHPILGAFCELWFRKGSDGTYSKTRPTNMCFVPDITNGLELTEKWGVHAGEKYWQPIDTCYNNGNSFFPLFGPIGLGNMTASTITGAVQIGTQPSSDPVSLTAGLLVGYNGDNLYVGYNYQGTSVYTPMKTMWLELEGTDENLEKLRKAAAAYGLFFTDGDGGPTGDYPNLFAAGHDEDRWTDENMCLGVVGTDGYTDGTYTRGSANEDAPNFAWKTASQSTYDPSRPPVPPSPDPTTADILPSSLDWTLAGSGTNIYALNPSEIQKAWQDIFGSGIDVKQFGNQPMNAILSLKWTPFDWTYSGIQHEKPIILGVQEANPLHVYKVIEVASDAQKHMSGIVNFKFNKNFFNARYMQARLFLPFYGYYELPTAQLLSSDLQLDFFYNIPDELGVWFISYRQEDSNQWVIYDYCECAIDMEVPLTGSNAAAISASRKQEALTIATQIASAAATIAVGGSTMLGVGQAARHLAQGIDALADVGLGWGSAGIESEAYLGMRGVGSGWIAKAGTAAGAIGAGVGAAINIYNTINNARIERAALRTNLPYHGSALQTTFLHLSMVPYVQIFKNNIMKPLSTTGNDVSVELGGTEKLDYMLKVGHACDVWQTLNNMPANSLCQTTGIANMDTTGLELTEVQELNSILQTGFYKSI